MYSDSERRIYGPFFSEQGERYADPLAVHRKLNTLLGPDPNRLLQQMESLDPSMALAAYEQFLNSVAFAFGVARFDPATGKGLLENELTALWNGFQDWLKKKVTRPENSPTSWLPMGGAGADSAPFTTPTSGWSSSKAGNACAAPGN